ncbi:MAG: DUF4390 domain-containing protein [Acidobacteriota bacterium]|nr:DUF4390 domain-containing protein [Acidobacteriota bacterium]
MFDHLLRRWLGGALILIILPLPLGRGRGVQIDQLQVALSEGAISVDFRVSGAFTEEVEEVIASGLPVTFHHVLRAYRRRTVWVDQRLSEKLVTTSVTFDILTKQYRVSRTVNGQMVDTLVTDKAEDMKNWMTVFEKIPLPSENPVETLDRLYVKVKSEIQNRFVFFFIPWDFETEWAKSDLIQDDEPIQP